MCKEESAKKEISGAYLTGERPLFGGKNLSIQDTIFTDGESPLKEASDIDLKNSMFQWKYPLWYAKNITAEDCTWFEMARAGRLVHRQSHGEKCRNPGAEEFPPLP